MIGGVGGRQKRQEILRERVQIPGGNEAAQTVENEKIRAVAISQAQARHAAVLAHAAHDQEIRKLVGKRKKTGNGVAGEIDERLVDDHQLQIPRPLQKFHHLFERDELAGGIAGIDDQQGLEFSLVHPGQIVFEAKRVSSSRGSSG